MDSKKLLLVSVLAAALMIAAAVAFVKFSDMTKIQTTPGQVTVDDTMRGCKARDDCIVVDTQCNFCCGYAAINAASEADFTKTFDKTCKLYKGAYCECQDFNSYPACVNGRCEMVSVVPPPKASVPPPASPAAPVTPPVATTPVAPETRPAPLPVPVEVPPLAPASDAVTSDDPFGETEIPEEVLPEEGIPAEETEEITPVSPADDLNAPLPETYVPVAPAADPRAMAFMSSSHDVIISGGGIPGLTLSLLLADAGITVGIIDPAPLSSLSAGKAEGRTSALMQGSIRTLERAGAWAGCRDQGAPLAILRIIDDSRGDSRARMSVDFPASDMGLDFFGVNMPNNILRAALAKQACTHKNIHVYETTALASFEEDDPGMTVVLEDGKKRRTRLLIGADGRHSSVRDKSGIKASIHEYGQSAITCLIRHSQPHEGVSTEFHRPGGPFTLVPMPGDCSSVVWVDFTGNADDFMKLDKKSFEQALQDRTCGCLGKISLVTDPQSCPLIALRASTLTGGRTALMAEAAHVLSPMGAQGLNLSLRDAESLGGILIDAFQTGLDPGSQAVLRRYDNERRGDIFLRSAGADGLTRLVSHHIRPLHELRRGGLKAVSVIEPLRHLAMKQGMTG